MNKTEIGEFIESMKKVGDLWTEEQTESIYGNVELAEAMADRRARLGRLSNVIEDIIKR